MKKDLFVLKNVSYFYRDIVGLEDINFCANRGERIVILGANGSGKSTLLKILNGLIFPIKGTFTAFGKQITQKAFAEERHEYDFRRKVGLVFQDSDAQLFSASVEDEIAFAPLNIGLKKEEAMKRVNKAIGVMGIEGLRGRVPHRLSEGEKKKVAIASILSYAPCVWLFDEPTTGLDPRSQDRLIEFICNLDQEENTVITATHDLSLAGKIAERIILLSEGHGVVADGDVKSVLSDKRLLLKHNLISSGAGDEN